MNDFRPLGLPGPLTDALERMGLGAPTPIQAQAIPPALEGRDVLGLAQTGTGKTLAFGLPLVATLMEARGRPAPKAARALVLAPTRELATQIADALGALAQGTRIGTTLVVGGQSLNRQTRALARGTDVLVATPGRLIDLMDRGAVDLGAVRQLVLDEADHMLDMGFIHALRRIAPALGTPRRTMMFSATMPKDMAEIARTYLSDPVRVEVSPPGRAADKVAQSVRFVAKLEKPAALREVLHEQAGATTLVFARTKYGAERLKKGLVADGFAAASIHGNKSQNQRDRALAAFRAGEVTVLVATDVAARGIDIPGVACVVNYELPEVPDAYVHRIGRTARAGREGVAVALCDPEEVALLAQIERVLGAEIPCSGGTRPEGTAPAPRRRGKSGGGGKPAGKPGGRRSGRGRRRGPRRAA